MFDLFSLPLFPQGSLASSVVTTVWVGVVVFSLMNLRLGWTFSGLVVPGYLVPLVIVKPWAAGVIVVEALLTHAEEESGVLRRHFLTALARIVGAQAEELPTTIPAWRT